MTETTPLGRVLERPADSEGTTVRVEGTVKAVCAHLGCWMSFAADNAWGAVPPTAWQLKATGVLVY